MRPGRPARSDRKRGNPMNHARSLTMASAFLGALSVPTLAKAQLGNLTYTQQEVNTSVSLFNAANMPGGPEGSNTVLLVKGYLIVMGSLDSGKPPGLFHIFDVKDPRNPKRV